MENREQVQKDLEAGKDLFGNVAGAPGDVVVASEVKEPIANPVASETVVSQGLANNLKNELRHPQVADGGLKNGYQFKDPAMTTEYNGEIITADNLTDKVACRLFAQQPRWAAENLTRGCYSADHAYWA
jgi:hypothetical protein